MTTELILIRHAESHPNVSPVIGGMHGDSGLTDLGREQAELLGRRLRSQRFTADVLYSSTLPRAKATATYVSAALDLPIRYEDGLQEVRVGEADGMSLEEWAARWPGLDNEPWRRPFQKFAPGGESWAEFLTRAGTALIELVERHPGERVVAVTHGGVLEASFAWAFGNGPTATPVRFAPRNTGLTVWRHDPDPGRPTWTLINFNDAAHLDAAG
jgi:2,3-bisphosphoglycerate-dependent phosphoglycerate mutase